MFQKFKNIISKIEYLDLFGQRVQILVNEKTEIRSKFGAAVSCIIYFFLVYFFLLRLISWVNGNDVTIISATKKYNIDDFKFLTENMSLDLTYENYNIYFTFWAKFQNGSESSYLDLERYFTQNLDYYNSNGTWETLEFQKCNISKMSIFVNDDPKKIAEELNEVSNFSICLKDNYPFGYFYDSEFERLIKPTFSYYITKCSNSSKNKVVCASNEEIEDLIPRLRIQIAVPETTFDFKNTLNQKKRSYKYEFYYLDKKLAKYYKNYLQTDIIKTE